MVEVIVAAVVFTLAAAGVLTAVSRARLPVSASDRRLQAATYGKQVLDQLRSDVSENTWNNSNWIIGNHDISGGGFNAYYVVTNDPVLGGKQVNLYLSW